MASHGLYGNPVRGTIHGASWTRPSGNTDFKLTQDFGPSSIDVEPTVKWPGGDDIPAKTYYNFHRGIDLGNRGCGADVLAARAGKVDFAAISSTGSRTVIINHGGGERTWYAHLGSDVVSVGQTVAEGQKIGTVGDTGVSGGCHLHFAIEWSHDGLGEFQWCDGWRRLKQNVKVRPEPSSGINIRTTKDMGSVYAKTNAAGRIIRVSDNKDLGPRTDWRAWGGTVTGASYTVDGITSTQWEKMSLDGKTLYIAKLLAEKNQT